MALKISLKPREKMIIDGAVITNGNSRCELYIENSVPILRQKDILTEEEADSPARRIYFTIQLMYIDEKNLAQYHKNYWKLTKDLIQAAPTLLGIIDEINGHILNGQYYRALKLAKQVIGYEREAIQHVFETASSVSIG